MPHPLVKDVFPADDPVACWLFVAFQWISDLWTLEATTEEHARAFSPDFLLFFRLVLSRFYDGERLVRSARRTPAVMAFIGDLPADAVAAFDQLEAAYAGGEISWAYRELKKARNLVSHYSQPDSFELMERLRAMADRETVFVADERTGRVRFLTADHAVMVSSFDTDPDRAMSKALELLDPIAGLRRSADVLFGEAQQQYFRSRGISRDDLRVLIKSEVDEPT